MTTSFNQHPTDEMLISGRPSNIIINPVRSIPIQMMSFGSRLHYIPVALVIFFPITFVLCYVIALALGHINAFFAFISDAGTLPPEQNVFSQLVNVGAALFAYFVYIRYVQVEQYMQRRFCCSNSIGNVIALALGFVSALGMSIVGNFPELVEKEVHLLGAFMAFVGGSIYVVFQGYFTFKMLPHFQSKGIAYIRTFLGILGLMLYFGAQSTIIVAFNKVTNKEKLESKPEALKWLAEDGGYNYRAASVIMEWLLVVIYDCFIITFVSEFKQFKLASPSVTFKIEIPPHLETTESLLHQSQVNQIVNRSSGVQISSHGPLRIDITEDYSLPTEDDDDVPSRVGGVMLTRQKFYDMRNSTK